MCSERPEMMSNWAYMAKESGLFTFWTCLARSFWEECAQNGLKWCQVELIWPKSPVYSRFEHIWPDLFGKNVLRTAWNDVQLSLYDQRIRFIHVLNILGQIFLGRMCSERPEMMSRWAYMTREPVLFTFWAYFARSFWTNILKKIWKYLKKFQKDLNKNSQNSLKWCLGELI